MKFKLLVACCYAVVCFCSDAMQPVSSRGSKEKEYKPPLYPINKYSQNEHDLSQQRKKMYSRKRGVFLDETTIAAEQLIKLSRSEIFQSNDSLVHEEKEVIKARCLFLASIRDMVIFRQIQSRTYKEEILWRTNIKKWQRELQMWQQELQCLKNKKKELEKNVEMARREAAASYLQLKLAQKKAKKLKELNRE